MKLRKTERIIIYSFIGLIVTLVLYMSARLWLLGEPDPLLLPGWHTIIYPPDVSFTIIALIALVPCFLSYFTLKGLSKIWLVLRKQKILLL